MAQAPWQKILKQLEEGKVRAAEAKADGSWQVNVAVKAAILAAFKAGKTKPLTGIYKGFLDKDTLTPRAFTIKHQIRMVPSGSTVRRGAYLASGVIVMPPSYINVGAYVDSGTMVDSHVLVGSCAQIGKNVHLSAAVQIGGVLEPIGANPVIIEDDVFIGAGVIVVEGVLVKKRAVLAPGVILSKATPIYDCVNKKIITDGVVPEGVVVIPGSRPAKQAWAKRQGLQINCPVIIKYCDAKTDRAVTLEKILRA
jgi:2,3,4,5-tetrahydropyridine-2,6-dicarboxylate N-succinyltransferase